ncbi:hypothetical protein PIROE2DRAFT_37077, partial [Piromyces sp. E2]
YCNSILQALYHCEPFRECIQLYRPKDTIPLLIQDENLLWELKNVFFQISTNKKKQGSVTPKRFIDILQKKNEIFRGSQHQDAQEFLNYLLNSISETPQQKSLLNVEEIQKKNVYSTWIHELFEGILTNEIKCLNCENVSCRDESFFDLSVDIEHNTSISSCLKNFSSSERLCQKNKFYCDTCCGLQEAEKRMKIKRAPNILALHLKRFKYEEKLNRYVKLPYRVLFPTELRLSNMTDKAENPDRLYNLFAITIHIGNGPYHGHYVTVVRGNNTWLMCDDENVDPIDELVLQSFFGDLNNYRCGYIFFYQAED